MTWFLGGACVVVGGALCAMSGGKSQPGAIVLAIGLAVLVLRVTGAIA